MKKDIRQVISSFLPTKLRIVEKKVGHVSMEKKLFIESILLLREIVDRKDFLESELGIDLTLYDEKYLLVIENLLRMNYTTEQINIINYYVYEIPEAMDYDGKIDISDGRNTITVKFETPEDVYNVVTSIAKPVRKFGRSK